ncbi:NUDIX hydrolase [Streptomyces sp. KL118A]|uniref:NUDIX hydrolase n=1 Tax=Streptomyces sp. KL118A TaxID=3045153 RepID=UPI00278C4E44|nr:NUDIX hydrolase [Streptomyces sp. KL118A]
MKYTYGDTVLAAGCVLWRPAPAAGDGAASAHGIELALVHRPKWSDWSHPKGKLKRGETFEEAALREVLEETGMTCELGAELPTAHYRDAQGRPKEVRYWAAEAISGTFAPNTEVSQLRWLSPDAARRHLTHRRDVGLVADLLAALAASGGGR